MEYCGLARLSLLKRDGEGIRQELQLQLQHREWRSGFNYAKAASFGHSSEKSSSGRPNIRVNQVSPFVAVHVLSDR